MKYFKCFWVLVMCIGSLNAVNFNPNISFEVNGHSYPAMNSFFEEVLDSLESKINEFKEEYEDTTILATTIKDIEVQGIKDIQ